MNRTQLSILALVLVACTTDAEPPPSKPNGELGRATPADVGDSASQGKEADRAATQTLQTSFDYHDGSDKRTVWSSTDLVAEFAPSDAGKDGLLRSDPAAEEVPQGQKGVRIWRVRAPQGLDAFAGNLSTGSNRFSPVYHEGPSAGFPMRALPGGVVATFSPSWNRARIDAWLVARGLEIESEVIPGGNMFLLPTRPGLEALQLANQLHESGELVACTPNFWLQASAR